MEEKNADAESGGIFLPSGSVLHHPPAEYKKNGLSSSDYKSCKEYYDDLAAVLSSRINADNNYFFDVSFCLHEIYRLNLYRMLGFKNIYLLSSYVFKIPRGVCSEMVSVWIKFSVYDAGIKRHVLDPFFIKFSGSQLSSLVHFPGGIDEIKKTFNPEMSVRDIKRKIKDVKACRDSGRKSAGAEPSASPSDIRNRIASCTARFQIMMDHLAYKPKAVGYYEDYSSFITDIKQLETILPDIVSGQDKIAIVHFKHS